jgi:hypothetical protein
VGFFLKNLNFCFPVGSPAVCRLSGARVAWEGGLGFEKIAWGGDSGFEKASQTWVIEGRLLGSLLQHFSRNSQSGPPILSEGLWSVSPAWIFSKTMIPLYLEYGMSPVKTWEVNVRFTLEAR